jgi:hypothetical protein
VEVLSNYWDKFERGGFTFRRGKWLLSGKFFLEMELHEGVSCTHQFYSETGAPEELWIAKADAMIAQKAGDIPKVISEFSNKELALEHWKNGREVLSPCMKFVFDDADIEEYFEEKEEQK